MARPKTSRPTDAELAILNVLWQPDGKADAARGLTIRQITSELDKSRPSTYATIQTLVRIMEKKGLLRRGEERYPALYYASAPATVAKGRLVRDFIDRVFEGSMKQLVMHALSGSKASKRDMQKIERIVDQMKD